MKSKNVFKWFSLPVLCIALVACGGDIDNKTDVNVDDVDTSSVEDGSVETEPNSYQLIGRYVSDDLETVVNAQLSLNEDFSLELETSETYTGTWSKGENSKIYMTIAGVDYSMEKDENGSYSFVFHTTIGEIQIDITMSNDFERGGNTYALVSLYQYTVNNLRKKYKDRTGGVIFYGASNFVKWTTMEEDLAEYDVMNKAFGGSNDFLLRYYANDLIYNSNPDVIVFQTSSNDWTDGSSKEAVEEYKMEFFDELSEKLPNCVFVILSQIPNPLRYFGNYHNGMVYVDEKIEEYCSAHDHFEFYSVLELLTDESGNANKEIWQSDDLHLNEKGFSLLAEAVNEELGLIAKQYNLDLSKKA